MDNQINSANLEPENTYIGLSSNSSDSNSSIASSMRHNIIVDQAFENNLNSTNNSLYRSNEEIIPLKIDKSGEYLVGDNIISFSTSVEEERFESDILPIKYCFNTQKIDDLTGETLITNWQNVEQLALDNHDRLFAATFSDRAERTFADHEVATKVDRVY